MSTYQNYESDGQTPHTAKTFCKLLGHLHRTQNLQAAAATATLLLWIADFEGQIGDLYTMVQVDAVAADENMVVDVLKNGVSILSAPLLISSAAARTGQQVGLLASVLASARGFVVGDVFTVSRVYTPGAAPLPLTGTNVVLEPSTGPY